RESLSMKLGFLVLPLALLPLTETVPGEPVSAAASTALQLNQIELGDEEWKVPPAARSLLSLFKQQLRELIGRELNGGAVLHSPASWRRLRDGADRRHRAGGMRRVTIAINASQPVAEPFRLAGCGRLHPRPG